MNEQYRPSSENPIEKLQALGVTVEPGRTYQEFHGQLNLHGLETLRPAAVKSLERVSRRCLEFLEGPIIRDAFESHEERRAWRANLDSELFVYYNSNKLRLNVITSIANGLELVVLQLDAQQLHSEEAEKIRAIHQSLPTDIYQYNELPNDEKNELLFKLDEICTRFLELVTSP